jgi:RimJ/RimL family protein N-acetyltransferase
MSEPSRRSRGQRLGRRIRAEAPSAPGRPTLPPVRARPYGRSMDTMRIRPIRPGDVSRLQRFYAELSAEDRRTRFLQVGARLTERQAFSFCTPDHAHRDGFVAVLAEGSPDERIVGHLCLEPDGPETAEVAIAVGGDFRHVGLGQRLLVEGIAWARGEGIARLTATMFADNAPIQRLLRSLGRPTVERSLGGGVTEVVIDIAEQRIAA